MDAPYYFETETIDNGPDRWNYTRVRILERGSNGSRQIGEYVRRLGGMYHTFCPFPQNGRWYALYSAEYTTTEVMELPECRRIAGEEPHTGGFCPVDFYVPHDVPALIEAGTAAKFGFVAGCIWGDDTSWKIQHLDLSRVVEGEIHRTERFGYIEMPDKARRLHECIDFSWYDKDSHLVSIDVVRRFNLDSGEYYDPVS
jgi:hypothetical protein